MIGAGLVGYGYWGPNLARCLAENGRSTLVAVQDLDEDARTRAARRHRGTRVVNDTQALIDDPSIDALVIATPVRTHFRLAMAALRAGKHVLVEKPLAASVAEAAALVAEASRRNLILMVDHTFVFTPAVQKIGELLKAGQIGELHYYDSVRVNLGLFQSDVNVVWDLAVHDLAILAYLLGDSPVSITAQGARHLLGRPESMAFVTMTYASGAVAHINVNWLAPVKVRQTLIGGSNKMIVYNDLEPSEKIKIYDKGVHLVADREQRDVLRVGYRTGDMWAPQLAGTEALKTAIDHFIDCVEIGNRPVTDGTVGLGIVELLEAATRSMRQGGRPIELGTERLAS